MLELIKQVMGDEWEIAPAGGLTGNAYIASKNDERLFLKRNTSPFLAVLSAEGIVPQLVWTKRVKNGDVITAQKWLDGRVLHPDEMHHPRVAKMLRKIHESSELLHMLMRLGIEPVSPTKNYEQLLMHVQKRSLHERYPAVEVSMKYLKNFLPYVEGYEQVVCHADINHKNIMISEENLLYLIDWDQAKIADPIIDFGTVLNNYIPKEDWEQWLNYYGIAKDDALIQRMYWYLILNTLSYLYWHIDRDESAKVIECVEKLQTLNNHLSILL